jgi:hypothetical protein
MMSSRGTLTLGHTANVTPCSIRSYERDVVALAGDRQTGNAFFFFDLLLVYMQASRRAV